AIDYVNARPHIGHAYEKVLADAIARWNRLNNKDVFFLTGVDENAQKNVEAAQKAGVSVKEFIDKNTGFFIELCKKLNLSHDDFIRTTATEHAVVVQRIIKKIIANGDIYKGEYSGLYCTGCEGYYTEKDLVDGKCPEHNKVPELRKETAYFFKLSKYKNQLLKIIPRYVIPESRKNEILSRVKEELTDICISRKGAKWGIDFPGDKDFKIWVWIDALINYISGLKGNEKKYWPADVHVIGKGINWFHSVIWPALLLSAGYKLPDKLLVHGYLNLGGQKMSKSLGNVIDPLILLEKYSTDTLRYSLLKCSVFEDSDYSEKILVERNNSELADKLGNLVSRIAGLIEKNEDGKIRQDKTDKELAKKLNLKKIIEHYNNYEIDKALIEIFAFIDECNLYVQKKEPWRLTARENEKFSGHRKSGEFSSGKELNKVLYSVSDSLRILTILLSPVIPESCERISEIYGFDLKKANIKDTKFDLYKPIKEIKKQNIFAKIESDLNEQTQMPIQKKGKMKPKENVVVLGIEPVKKTETKTENKKEFVGIAPLSEIKYDDFAKLDIRVAKILDVKPHPNADKLLVLDIDLGFEKRTLVAGLKEHYKPEQLKGKKVIVLANLEGKELRGIMSKGMILAAVNNDRTIVGVLHPDKDIPVGSKIS
ncbi:methionine--tRNA ligase, partial [Candidatus Pacearchaeota archaeon]|nr:methionine--tRNA ligase [Candidatus Pacearchaeota archaeon]